MIKWVKRSGFSLCEYCLRIALRTTMTRGIHRPHTPPSHLQLDIVLDGGLQPLAFCRYQSWCYAWHELEDEPTFLSRSITRDSCPLRPCYAWISSSCFLFGSLVDFFLFLLAFQTGRFHHFRPVKVFGILLCKSLSSRSHNLSFSSFLLSWTLWSCQRW